MIRTSLLALLFAIGTGVFGAYAADAPAAPTAAPSIVTGYASGAAMIRHPAPSNAINSSATP